MGLMGRLAGHPAALAMVAFALGCLVWSIRHPSGTQVVRHADVAANPPAAAAPAPRAPAPSEAESTAPAAPKPPADSAGREAPAAVDAARGLAGSPSLEGLEPQGFGEVWGYLYLGEESRWHPQARLSDVALFGVSLDEVGRPLGAVKPASLELARTRGARPHLVVASSSQKTLLHFLLDPRYGARAGFVGDLVGLVQRTPELAGLQLDFESLRSEDRGHFVGFLAELRRRLPRGKTLSLALPARREDDADDPFRYRDLGGLADRFLIMVYDEHWQGGAPGSIASRQWHDKVVAHALASLPLEKVIVGLPLYGRLWQVEPQARALRYGDVASFLQSPEVELRWDKDASHRFRLSRQVTLEGWFEDASSLHAKLSSARRLGARRVGFWRLGQEDPRLWSLLKPIPPR